MTDNIIKIENVVELKKHKYVMPEDKLMETRFGPLRLVRGMLSDGASCVLDIDLNSFFPHDWLFILPNTETKKNLSKKEVDLVYYDALRKSGHYVIAVIRYFGLQHCPGTRHFSQYLWNRNRDIQRAMGWAYEEFISQEYFVPRKACWDFPTYYTKDAVWRGCLAIPNDLPCDCTP